MDKTVKSVEEALSGIEDGACVAIGGFFAAGVPRILLKALIAKGVKKLTLACGSGPLLGAKEELNELVNNGQIRKMIDSYGLSGRPPRAASIRSERSGRARSNWKCFPWELFRKIPHGRRQHPAFFVPVSTG